MNQRNGPGKQEYLQQSFFQMLDLTVLVMGVWIFLGVQEGFWTVPRREDASNPFPLPAVFLKIFGFRAPLRKQIEIL